MSTPEVSMPLPIEQAVTWWQFVNMPEQDPDLLAVDAFRLSGVIADSGMFADAIATDHEVILTHTAEALGMELAEVVREALAGRILWHAHMNGGWVQARRLDCEFWTSVPGIHDTSITLRHRERPGSRSRPHPAVSTLPGDLDAGEGCLLKHLQKL